MTTSRLLLPALARAYALSENRGTTDPEFQEALVEVQELQEAVGWTVIRLDGDTFAVGGEPVRGDIPELRGFHEVLEGARIREMRIQGSLDPALVRDFFWRLGAAQGEDDHPASEPFRGMGDGLGLSFETSFRPLRGMSGGIQDLFYSWEPEDFEVEESETPKVEQTEVGDPGPGVEGFAEPDSPEPVGVTLPAGLEDELTVFSRSHGKSKTESGEKLQEWATRLRENRDHGALTELVCVLAEGGVGDEADRGAEELAVEITTSTIASLIVARLGVARHESERTRLATVISRIGPEGVDALADALGESRDRAERRAFLDAMVSLGPPALDRAKKMVEDPRWFVVRNGVTVLGELGGDEAIGHLTGTLANEDQRVRRETVQALARIGSSDAEALTLGMLEDPAPGVRSAACRGLGALRSERGIKPLVGRLKDESVDVQVEAIQALGLIGDPGPVKAIQKLAFGGFFTRPPREVRIAAFRALAAIGTPGALRAVEKGTKDGDEVVRRSAQATLKGR